MKNNNYYYIKERRMPLNSTLISRSLLLKFPILIKKLELSKNYLSLILISSVVIKWSLKVKKENILGIQSKPSIKLLKSRFVLFILSEIMIFMSLFWNLLNNSIAPNVEIGNKWTPIKIENPNPFLIASFGSVALIYSGIIITSSHNLLIKNIVKKANNQIKKCILIGAIFIDIQISEYSFRNYIIFRINDSNYRNNFFLITGVHGSHVIAGILILIVSINFIKTKKISKKRFSRVEISSWYWHFVDILWLFVFSLIYWVNFFS